MMSGIKNLKICVSIVNFLYFFKNHKYFLLLQYFLYKKQSVLEWNYIIWEKMYFHFTHLKYLQNIDIGIYKIYYKKIY